MTLPDHQALATADRAVDLALAELSKNFRFILDLTPVDADEVKEEFLEGRVAEPVFAYRTLEADPEVARELLSQIDVSAVEDATVGHLLRAKHRELELQLDMLQARGSEDFLQLSIELYGGVTPKLREQAEEVLRDVTRTEAPAEPIEAEEFLALALAEIDHYRSYDPEIEMHAEIRPDVTGVMVSGDTLLIGPDAHIQRSRAEALLHHEVGTHLVTQVNGTHQPIKVLGSGLSGYDETQEGLAVLAEIACGGLTAFRLRQLAGRVITVHRMITGDSFAQAHAALVDSGFPPSSAFTTVMRVYRSGGMTKDVIYLRGLVDLLQHLRAGGNLDSFWLGKFSLADLPLIEDLALRGIIGPARLRPRHLDEPRTAANLQRAASTDTLSELLEGQP